MYKIRLFRAYSRKRWWIINKPKLGQFIKVFNDLNELAKYLHHNKYVFPVSLHNDLTNHEIKIVWNKMRAMDRKAYRKQKQGEQNDS